MMTWMNEATFLFAMSIGETSNNYICDQYLHNNRYYSNHIFM